MNPFKAKTTSYYDWEVLKDLEWHCTKCELSSAQAKTWQVWRQKGIQLAKDENGNWYKKLNCNTCEKITIHRKLESLDILDDTNIRSGITLTLIRKIKQVYNNQEALFLRIMPPRELEVDHKFPQIRWGQDENRNEASMSEEEIRSKFILLTRSNNLLKSRYCERCVKDRIRGNFPGIYFWYNGDENWRGQTKCDEAGCEGCFWYDPYKWRDALNCIVNKIHKKY